MLDEQEGPPPPLPVPPVVPVDLEGVVLRPRLYARLVMKFADRGGVGVSNRGMEMCWGLRTEGGRSYRYIDAEEGHHGGENYVVRCPYCHDHKRRLYVNHLWGHRDELTGSDNLWLVHCQNEGCIRDQHMRLAFHGWVWDDTTAGCGGDVVRRGKAAAPAAEEASWPCAVFMLDSESPAVRQARNYWAGRRFNPDFLGKMLHVGVIGDPPPELWYLRDRTIIPVYREGKMVGWQARLTRDPKDKNEPKYVFSAGFPRSQVLYNFDNAKQFPFVVVVEGATKVWRFGPEAVATFGKAVTYYQAGLLLNNWKKVVVMLDPNAMSESRQLVEQIRSLREVVLVELPEGCEPDEMETAAVRRLVFDTAAAQGVTLTGG